MRRKEYKHRTKILGIPVPGYDDSIWPEVEMQKWQLVENMLLAGARGFRNCVFEEGHWKLDVRPDGKYLAKLSADGINASAAGMVGGAYFRGPSTVSWGPIEPGREWWLYLEGSQETFGDSSKFRLVVSHRILTRRNILLMAWVNLKGAEGVLDAHPDGKLVVSDLQTHVLSGVNPHGDTLYQDKLSVNQELVFPEGSKVVVGDESIDPSSLIGMKTGNQQVIPFETAGKDGVVLKASGRVRFVLVSQEGSLSGSNAVSFSVGYFGSDTGLGSEQEFIVYSDRKGVSARALVVMD